MSEMVERVAKAIEAAEGQHVDMDSLNSWRLFVARAAIEAIADWQPIETAPTDGTPILGWSDEGVSYVCWNRKGQWVFFRNHRGDEWHFEPTKWMPHPAMPLPAPPVHANQGAGR